MNSCFFIEPWIGRCNKVAKINQICCEEHVKEKCHVCGAQATTRCQASRGFMCGIPMCANCGVGEMCVYHAGSGPLMVIKAMLGGGPEPGVFSTKESLIEQADKMKLALKTVSQIHLSHTMQEFEETNERTDENV